MTEYPKNCMYSGRYCLKEKCKGWITVPGSEHKDCAFVTSAMAQIVLAEAKLSENRLADPFGSTTIGEIDE